MPVLEEDGMTGLTADIREASMTDIREDWRHAPMLLPENPAAADAIQTAAAAADLFGSGSEGRLSLPSGCLP